MPLSPPPAEGSLPFLDHLRHESARFREVLSGASPEATVPTCPDWHADDLLWHLADVQWFWGEIAERRLTEESEVQALDRPSRPSDRAGLLRFFDRSSERLHRALSALPPDRELWMWADEHTAGYIRRRQAHEALMHRIDAKLTAGAEHTRIDCQLAADGVDEALRIMRGFESEPGFTGEPIGATVTIAVVDGMHAWTVTPLRVTGLDDDGTAVDVLRFRVNDGPDPAAASEIAGTAADLDCWLWNRPIQGEISRTGDPQALALVERVLSSSID